MARYLRFAAAGFFALLTVALIGFWVRSYYRVDVATAPLGKSGTMLLGSQAGGVMLDWTTSDSLNAKAAWEFQVEGNYYLARDILGFRLISTPMAIELILPH